MLFDHCVTEIFVRNKNKRQKPLRKKLSKKILYQLALFIQSIVIIEIEISKIKQIHLIKLYNDDGNTSSLWIFIKWFTNATAW